MTKRPRNQPDLLTPQVDIARAKQTRVRWATSYRLIQSRFPPIDVFERVAPREDWDVLYQLEGLTNPRLRQEAGEISLVPPSRRVNGPGATIVMAPFTHASKDRPTRFSDGSFGVYYAGHEFETALREVAYHLERFHASTGDGPTETTFRTYAGKIDRTFHDIRKGSWKHLLDPSPRKYAAPQAFAAALRLSGSNGIVYPSVRNPDGECIAAFWPDVVAIPQQNSHLQLRWDGKRVSAWFEMIKDGKWQSL